MGIKRVVLITTGQPSVNPRIVKEANALHTAGYDVLVLYCFWIKWAEKADAVLLKNVKWNYQLVGGSPSHNKWLYIFTKSRLKLSRLLNKKLGNKLFLPEKIEARCYNELLKIAKSMKADWYIGHNLGALPVVVQAAKYNNAKSGFDFEDYHREEVENMHGYDLQRIIYIEEKYVPQLQYISTASTLITGKVKQNFPLYKNEVITILNCFSLSQQPVFIKKTDDDKTLQLFWFSQTIGKNRGLEILFKALEELNDSSIHVTLAGKCNEDFKTYIDHLTPSIKANIHLAGIIQPENLPAFAAEFDVGMAIELATPKNRDICLTNKIFIYVLAGNAVIFSGTSAQKDFNDQYKIGELFKIDSVAQLKANINFYRNNLQLEPQRKHNYELATNLLNWEKESQKLLSVID